MSAKPAATVVFGDVNSTIACALAAVKLGIPVVHVEAGLRSFDRTMPEEINRILTDAMAEFLLVSEESGIANLQQEGVAEEQGRARRQRHDRYANDASASRHEKGDRSRVGPRAPKCTASSRFTVRRMSTTRRH